MSSPNRFSPLKLNSHHQLRNRVVVPPMGSATATTEGFVTMETLQHYALLAEANPGLLIVEYTYVHATGRNEERQLGIATDTHTKGLSALAQLIRQSGALAGIQLSHSGGKSNRLMTEGKLMGPSGVTVPTRDRHLEKPDSMTIADIEMWKEAFIQATDRATQAGFELVEFHAAHGYGINQMLSPFTNHRHDDYGGSFAGRTRLLREIIEAVKKNHPELLISVRMPGQDLLENGFTSQDSIELAKMLEQLGVTILNVSSGMGGGRPPTQQQSQEGYLAEDAGKIQAAVKIPVIAVGGIRTGEYIDEGLRSGRFALAAVGRALRENPKAWFKKNLAKNPAKG